MFYQLLFALFCPRFKPCVLLSTHLLIGAGSVPGRLKASASKSAFRACDGCCVRECSWVLWKGFIDSMWYDIHTSLRFQASCLISEFNHKKLDGIEPKKRAISASLINSSAKKHFLWGGGFVDSFQISIPLCDLNPAPGDHLIPYMDGKGHFEEHLPLVIIRYQLQALPSALEKKSRRKRVTAG